MNAISIPLFKQHTSKIIVTILTVLTYAVLISCSSDENNQQTDNLLGEWKLISFVDTANDTTITENDFENSNEITITFKEDFRYKGSTVRNSFFGEYDTTNDSETILILLKGGGVTEVNETDWGTLFFEKMLLTYNPSTGNRTYNYQILDNELKLYYSENEYMRFDKK